MNEIVVIPVKNSHSPESAYIGYPGIYAPSGIQRILVSCVFTWHKKLCEKIAIAWRDYGNEVLIGGPAYDDPGGEFTPGQFTRTGITITSRGCPRHCSFCYVPKREGNIRELKTIHPGNILQDNNLLACGNSHINKVFDMLKTQKHIRFTGGIDSRILLRKQWVIDTMRGLSIHEIWLASDSRETESKTLKAISLLREAGFSRNNLRCYVLIGYENETQDEARERLENIWNAGAIPFAQLFDGNQDRKIWHDFTRNWSRPAQIAYMMRPARARIAAEEAQLKLPFDAA